LGVRQTRIFVTKLHLIDVGRVNEALELDDLLATVMSGAGCGRLVEGKVGASKAQIAANGGKAIDEILDKKLALGPPPTSSNNGGLTSHERSARRQTLKAFQSACTKCIKCANCSAFSPKIRHDQFNKMFQIPLSAKGKKSNLGNRVRIRSACSLVGGGLYPGEDSEEEEEDWPDSEDEVMDDVEEEDSDDDEGDGLINDEAAEDKPSSSKKKRKKTKNGVEQNEEEKDTTVIVDREAKQDNFMNNLEIEAQCRLTWEKQPLICSKFFGSAHSPEIGEGSGGIRDTFLDSSYVTDDEDNTRRNRPRSVSNAELIQGGGKGYSIFFLRAIPVPPSRFRPPVIMGSTTIEHAQNFYLSRVLELNAQLRTMFNATHEFNREEGELKSALANSHDGTDTARQLKKVRDDKDKTQANLLRVWVELQTTVNCFMDSTRDPKSSGGSNAPNGIRQLLEKKEGIFRKHMMGKRVNYACRSVISPGKSALVLFYLVNSCVQYKDSAIGYLIWPSLAFV